jgi:small subunit ribosomal protein S13e
VLLKLFGLQFQDKDGKFRLILVESRIHRLARYYKTRKVLPPNWK